MPELTKKDIREAVVESLEPFAKAVQEDFRAVNIRLDKVDARFDKVDVRFDKVDARLDTLDGRLSSVEADVKWMRENSGELFTKLDRFIALLEKNEQEVLMLSAQVKRLEERIEKIEVRLK